MPRRIVLTGARCLRWLMIATVALGCVPLHAEDVTTPNWKRSIPPAKESENAAVYFSNGDNEIFFNVPPIDSPEAIDEVLDVLKQAYGIKRIYWRAPQIDQIIYRSVVRKESAHHGPWIQWMDHLFRDLDTGNHMIRAARKRGMEVWGVASLFDHGSQAYIEYPNKGMGPFFTENRIRVEHPEWIPIDRAGIRRMSGPICFAYPEARKALVQMYVDMVRDKGYTGLSFHLYNENQGPRFDDEFGFNEPIVDAYKKRYDIDIRTEPYDKQQLADLRGEFLTQFFRELREAFKPLNVKISVMLDAKDPDMPQYWLAFREIRLSGRVRVDWRTYARENLVDELFVYFNGDPFSTLRDVMKEIGDTNTTFAILDSGGAIQNQNDLLKAGVCRVISGQSEELEYGYQKELPLDALDSDDFVARLSVLTQMGEGTTPIDIERVLDATHDPSILVRRRALRLLVTINDTRPQLITGDVITRVIELLDDPQNIVRCTAVNTLAHLGGREIIPTLYDGFARHANSMMHLFSPVPLSSLPADRNEDLVQGMRHPSRDVRIMAIRIASGGAARPETWSAILENTQHEDWMVRWNAARALEFIYPDGTIEALYELLDDPHPTVRNIAARNLSKKLKTETRWVGGMHHKAVAKLTEMFASYGQGCTSRDAEWGWRNIGLALQRMGPRGKEVLEGFLNQSDDPQLAHQAWHVLYVVEEDFKIITISEEEAEAGYRMHPSLREQSDSSAQAAPEEPDWMPYIVNNFDDAAASDAEFGSAYAQSGRWRKAQVVVRDKNTGGQCLRIQGGGGIESVTDSLRIDYRVNSGALRVSFSVMRQQPDAEITVWVTSSNQWDGNLRVHIGPQGVVWFESNGRAVQTDHQVSPGQWQDFELVADLDQRRFSLFSKTGEGLAALVENQAISDDREFDEFNALVILPGKAEGTECFIDRVHYEVTNPFASKLSD